MSRLVFNNALGQAHDRIELSAREVWSFATQQSCGVLTATANVIAIYAAEYIIEEMARRPLVPDEERIDAEDAVHVKRALRSAILLYLLPDELMDRYMRTLRGPWPIIVQEC